MHTDRSDVTTGARLCCCKVELCATSVENRSSDQIKLPFICSSTADGRKRELTLQFRITIIIHHINVNIEHLSPGTVNKSLPCNLQLRSGTELERLTTG